MSVQIYIFARCEAEVENVLSDKLVRKKSLHSLRMAGLPVPMSITSLS